MSRNLCFAIAIVSHALFASAFAPLAAKAQVKPFAIVGGGEASHIPMPGDATEHWSVGLATHLGAYQQQGAFAEPLTLDMLDPSEFYPHRFGTVVAVGTFRSAAPAVFESLGGGSLVFDYGHKTPGVIELILTGFDENNAPIYTTEWDAIFTLVRGTGRFKKATAGEFRMIAVTDEFGGEAFIPNPDWTMPGVAYFWYSLPGGWVKFKK